MYNLYCAPGSAAMAPHAMLEEIGAPFELIKVDTTTGQQHSPDYRKLNPHARVPTLIYDGDRVMYKSTAICLFLADRHPDIPFVPKSDGKDRGLFLQWMAYLTNTLQEACMHWWHPEKFVDGENEQAAVKRKAELRTADMFRFLDGQLAKRAVSVRLDLLHLRLLRRDAGALDPRHGDTRAHQSQCQQADPRRHATPRLCPHAEGRGHRAAGLRRGERACIRSTGRRPAPI